MGNFGFDTATPPKECGAGSIAYSTNERFFLANCQVASSVISDRHLERMC